MLFVKLSSPMGLGEDQSEMLFVAEQFNKGLCLNVVGLESTRLEEAVFGEEDIDRQGGGGASGRHKQHPPGVAHTCSLCHQDKSTVEENYFLLP